MAQLKYFLNGQWVSILGMPNASDSVPGLIKVQNNLTTLETGMALDASQGKLLKDQIDELSEKTNIIDISNECALQNGWTYYQNDSNNLRVLDCGSYCMISGLLSCGTNTVNTHILSIPSRIANRVGRFYYIPVRALGNGYLGWAVLRDGYLSVDNNAAIPGSGTGTATSGNLVVFSGTFPYIQ